MVSSRRSRKTAHLNYNHLHYFHVAAVEGSVGGAAQCLGLTQPTISEQLRTLERSLGVVLFERQPSGLKLTEAGKLTFKHTQVMFSAGERLAEELQHESRSAPCRLRVGVCSAVARMSTPSVLTPLLGLSCMPTVHVAEYVELAREFRDGALDLLLCDCEPPKSERRGVDVTIIERTILSVVAQPSFAPSDNWRDVHMLQYRVGSTLRWDVDAFLEARGLAPQIAAEADDALLLLDAVLRSNYVAIVPQVLVRDAVASGRLRELETFESARAGLFALFQPGTELVRNAVDRLVAHLAASR